MIVLQAKFLAFLCFPPDRFTAEGLRNSTWLPWLDMMTCPNIESGGLGPEDRYPWSRSKCVHVKAALKHLI